MQIGLSPTSPTGVLIAQYSNRYSRMWAWDVDTQEILGFQDVKGRASLLDVSEDGLYCGWLIDAKAGYDTHMGVSHPYSFHALFWRRTVVSPYSRDPKPSILFDGNRILHFGQPEDYQQGDEILRVQLGCPFELVEMDAKDSKILKSPRVVSLHGQAANLTDRCGRRVELGDNALLSDGHPLIDLTRPEFTAIPHPDWAKVW